MSSYGSFSRYFQNRPRWPCALVRCSKKSVAAKARIQMLAVSSPGEYLILDEDTGNRILVMLLGASTQSQRRRVGVKERVSGAAVMPV